MLHICSRKSFTDHAFRKIPFKNIKAGVYTLMPTWVCDPTKSFIGEEQYVAYGLKPMYTVMENHEDLKPCSDTTCKFILNDVR